VLYNAHQVTRIEHSKVVISQVGVV
jgi:hypothetical protein